MNQILETDRLRLREFTLDDAPFIKVLVNTPGWLKYIGERNVQTEEQARGYLTRGPIKSYQENGFGLWMVELKENATPIGMCGLLRRDFLDHPDIGFAFLPDYHGKGYAYEAAQATLSFAKNQLGLATLCAITLPTNSHSIKLLEKIGMKYLHPVLSPLSHDELLLYSH